ncbi:hypothetical protein B0H17DRAFT_1149184 [Mycena rosella]|uniref:Uncharacterized protein n=1 Tax=Mycena rosella TaxID=1033263 RepID=A0AAD7FS93_MYCRO|nr:hypothetical protein B0H17DRAFT_1149184 [Mycena rosella]
MDPPPISLDLEIQRILEDIRHTALPELQELAQELLPTDKAISLQSSLLVYYSSKSRIVPRQYQLEANNALADGLDICKGYADVWHHTRSRDGRFNFWNKVATADLVRYGCGTVRSLQRNLGSRC